MNSVAVGYEFDKLLAVFALHQLDSIFVSDCFRALGYSDPHLFLDSFFRSR